MRKERHGYYATPCMAGLRMVGCRLLELWGQGMDMEERAEVLKYVKPVFLII
jgi:hypothetical protein